MSIRVPRIGPFFERVLIYLLLTDLLIRIIFEVGLGIQPRSLTQHRQYLLYGLIALDYCGMFLAWFSSRRIKGGIEIKRLNPLIAVLILMILQGVLVGLYMENSIKRILIDTTVVAVLLTNLVLFANPKSFQQFDLRGLERFAYAYSFLMIFMGFIMQAAYGGKNAVSLGNTPAAATALAIILTGLILSRTRRSEYGNLFRLFLIMGLILPFSNRTSIVAFLIIFALYLIRRAHRPVQILSIMAVLSTSLVILVAIIPKDSKIAVGVQGIATYDSTERTGSIGERHAEEDAIKMKIDQHGDFARTFGLGHGAAYDVKYTWKMQRDYSFAHFSWALFNLRWGFLGYIYLSIIALSTVLLVARYSLSADPVGLIVTILCVFNLFYMLSYCYFLFLTVGAPFALNGMLRGSPDRSSQLLPFARTCRS